MIIQLIKPLCLLSIIILMTGATSLPSKKYEIEIIQDGKAVEVKDSIVELKKEPFQIKVTLKNHEGIFMSASFNRDYYDTKEHEEIKDYKWLNSKARAESNFNADQELAIHDESLSYLFYEKELDWHRFDKEIIVNKKEVIGTKTIKKMFVESTQETIDLKDVDKPVYLFFFATKKWKSDNPPRELGRIKLKLVWK